MKKLIFFVLLFSACAFGQGVRYDLPPIINTRGLPIANVQISLCTGTATVSGSTCGTPAQSFTDITLGTQCSVGLPVTLPGLSTCQGTSDGAGNAGFWLSPGAYIYCLNGPSVSGQCYNLTVPAGSTPSGSLIAGAGTFTSLSVPSIFNAKFYGAKGDGSTDDTAAIQSAMDACFAAGGGTVYIPQTANGYSITQNVASNLAGGIRGLPGCNLIGNNTKIIRAGNSSDFIHYDSSLGSPNKPTTVTTATVVADTTVGQTNFMVDSSSGFVVGDQVHIKLGQNPTDAPETQYFAFAFVSAIPDTTHITLDRQINFAMTVASTQASDRQILKFSNGVIQNVEIAGFILTTPNGVNAEEGVNVRYARNVYIHDIQATDPGAGAVNLQYCDNVTVSNIDVQHSLAFGGQTSKGRGLSFAEVTNVDANNIRISNFDHAGIFVESYSKKVRINQLQTINNPPSASLTNNFEVAIVQGSTVWINGWRAEGTASSNLVDYGGATGNSILQDVTVNQTGTQTFISQPVLANMRGYFNFINGCVSSSVVCPNLFTAPRWWSGTVLLNPSTTTLLNLPDGVYKRMRIYANTVTGITSAVIVTPGNAHNSADFHSSLSAGNAVDITNGSGVVGLNSTGANNFVITGKQLGIAADGTLPVNSYINIWLEYYPEESSTNGFAANSTITPLGTALDQIHAPLLDNFSVKEQASAPSGSSGNSVCYADSTAHATECSFNNDTFSPLVKINSNKSSGTVDLTAQAANVASTPIVSSGNVLTGTYLVACTIEITQAATTSSTLPLCQVGYFDDDTAASVTQALTGTSTANTVGTHGGITGGNTYFIRARSGNAINAVTASYASSGATAMQYAVHWKAIYLGP